MSELAETPQAVLKAVGREAIRLALRQLVRQYRVMPKTPSVLEAEGIAASLPQMVEGADLMATPYAASPLPEINPMGKVGVNPLAPPPPSQIGAVAAVQPAVPVVELRPQAKSAKLSKQQEQAELEADARTAAIQHIGQQLLQARHAKSLSLDHVHSLTRVPLHHLRALEAGRVDQLPEDIYVQGFVRRVGDALGLNGAAIAAELPMVDPAKTVIPSWQRSPARSSTSQPVHLYLGYAALMAGAVGGLAWISQQPAPDSVYMPDLSDSSSAAMSQPQVDSGFSVMSGAQAREASSFTSADMAPPEMLPF